MVAIAPSVSSHGYSALDFALWGQSQGSPQAGAVASYLQAHYPHMPCQYTQWGRERAPMCQTVDWAEVVARSRGIQTPVSGMVERLLAQQGSRPDQSLGAGHAADALLTPLSPEEPRHDWGGLDARTQDLTAAFRATKFCSP